MAPQLTGTIGRSLRRTVEMEHACHQFFSRSAFSLNQDGAVAVSDFLNKVQDLLHRLADADQIARGGTARARLFGRN